MPNVEKATGTVKHKTEQSVGSGTADLRSEILAQAAQLGLTVVEYLLSDEGHRPTIELRMAEMATELKLKLEEWNGF